MSKVACIAVKIRIPLASLSTSAKSCCAKSFSREGSASRVLRNVVKSVPPTLRVTHDGGPALTAPSCVASVGSSFSAPSVGLRVVMGGVVGKLLGITRAAPGDRPRAV